MTDKPNEANPATPAPVAVDAGLVDLTAELRDFAEMPLEGGAADPLIETFAVLASTAASALTSLQAQVEALTRERDGALFACHTAWNSINRFPGSLHDRAMAKLERVLSGQNRDYHDPDLKAAEAKVEALTRERQAYAEALSDAIFDKNDEIASLRQTTQAADAEVTRLRAALIEAGRNAGGGLADTVSTDFLMNVPEEVRLVVTRLRKRVEEQDAALEKIETMLGTAFTAGVYDIGPPAPGVEGSRSHSQNGYAQAVFDLVRLARTKEPNNV